jgi:hypothetical protein
MILRIAYKYYKIDTSFSEVNSEIYFTAKENYKPLTENKEYGEFLILLYSFLTNT